MLKECKATYEKLAELIPNWKTMDKSDLIRFYCEVEHTDKQLKEACVSAIMCRYWNAIYKYYQHQGNKFTPDDYHDWLVHAVTYTLEHKPWLNEWSTKTVVKTLNEQTGMINTKAERLSVHKRNKLYGDPKGPDKAMNKCIAGSEVYWLDYWKKDCRAIHYAGNKNKNYDGIKDCNTYIGAVKSIEQMIEDKEDYLLGGELPKEFSFIDREVKNCVERKEYLEAYIMFSLAYNTTVRKKVGISKIMNIFENLDSLDYTSFAEMFGFNLMKVAEIADRSNRLLHEGSEQDKKAFRLLLKKSVKKSVENLQKILQPYTEQEMPECI